MSAAGGAGADDVRDRATHARPPEGLAREGLGLLYAEMSFVNQPQQHRLAHRQRHDDAAVV